MSAEGMLTMGEAAAALGLTKARVSQLAAQGALEARMVGGRKMATAASVEAYGASRRPSGAAGRVDSTTAVRLTLMCADYEVACLLYDPSYEYPLELLEVLDAARMPFGCATSGGRGRKRELNSWWEHRSVPDSRPGMLSRLSELGVRVGWELPARGLGLSLSDCYWVRPDGRDDLVWADLNYFENDFEGCRMTDLEDRRAVDSGSGWDAWLASIGLDSPDNTSEGELPKRWAIRGCAADGERDGERNGERVLIKGCGADDQRPFNETVATALHARLLGMGEYVPYEVVRVAGGPACVCPDFLGPREEYVPAVYVKDAMGAVRGSSTYDRLCRFAGMHGSGEGPVRDALSKMIVCDSILANTDRHWRNFGFVRNVDSLELRPAPLFDTGNCLWYEKTSAQVEAGDWSFAAKPFGPEPERQLAMVDVADWFDPEALEGFVEEALGILAGSAHASQPGRLGFIARGLRRRIDAVSEVMGVLRYRG